MVVKCPAESTMKQSTAGRVRLGQSTTGRGGDSDRSRTDSGQDPSETTRRLTDHHPDENDASASVDPASLLSVLEDEHARVILNAVSDDSRPARELVEECDASRATVYRRLGRLEELGLVTSGMQIDSSGHHRKVFEATLDEATISLSGAGFSVEVTVESPAALADAPVGETTVHSADD
jgi:DNA-binding transcriptional ArsR family regulator